jgi:hypothetical protein
MLKPGGIYLTMAAISVAIAVSAPRLAHAAKRRIVLMEIQGARSDRLRKSVAKLLDHDLFILPERAYRKVAERRGIDKLNTSNIRRVCADLGCDGILDGVIQAEDGGYIFTVRLHEGASGRIVKRVAMRLKKPRLPRELADGLRDRLLTAIADLEPIGAQEPMVADSQGSSARRKRASRQEDVEESRPARSNRRAKRARGDLDDSDQVARNDDRETDRSSRSGRRARADEDENLDEEGQRDSDRDEEKPVSREKSTKRVASRPARDSEEEESTSKSKSGGDDQEIPSGIDSEDAAVTSSSRGAGARDPREYPVEISAGLSFEKRNLSFNSSPTLTGAQVPTPYTGNPAPGIFATGELYPLAFVDNAAQPLKNIGFGFTVDRVLGLRVQSKANGMNVTASAVQARTEINLRYRYNFGSQINYPTLTASVGYGQLEFAIDQSQANFNVPNVQYQYINPGLNLRVPIGTTFSVQAEARYMAVLSAGDIQLESQYGKSLTTGFDADAFVQAKFLEHFLVRAGLHFTFVGFAFNTITPKTDPTGDMKRDVGGASDQYLGGYLTLGYEY